MEQICVLRLYIEEEEEKNFYTFIPYLVLSLVSGGRREIEKFILTPHAVPTIYYTLRF